MIKTELKDMKVFSTESIEQLIRPTVLKNEKISCIIFKWNDFIDIPRKNISLK